MLLPHPDRTAHPATSARLRAIVGGINERAKRKVIHHIEKFGNCRCVYVMDKHAVKVYAIIRKYIGTPSYITKPSVFSDTPHTPFHTEIMI